MIFTKELKNKIRGKRWFITGGAGFIGSHLVDSLISADGRVTVYDNLSSGNLNHLKEHIQKKKIVFYQKDLLDMSSLTRAMAGHDIVWHLGASTDIPSGFRYHRLDLDNGLIATYNVLEAMLKNRVKEILFSSTGAVYGESIKGAFKETAGPLLPLSLYAAGKLACEAFISAYCHLFGLRAWIYRFGNVIGDRMSHGVVYDFVRKLQKNPSVLEILGSGIGSKNYFLVEECIGGMFYVYHTVRRGFFPKIFNLGADSNSSVLEIADIVCQEMNLSKVLYTFTGEKRGWPGDQPVVRLDTGKIQQLGWRVQRTSNEAVRTAARRLLGKEKFRLTL